MRKHMGNILEAAIRKSGYPISTLAKRIGYTLQHIYNLFQQANVDLMLMEEIGKVIQHDFSKEIVELKKYRVPETSLYTSVNDPEVAYESMSAKYLVLLEEYNKLLKEYNELLKKTKK